MYIRVPGEQTANNPPTSLSPCNPPQSSKRTFFALILLNWKQFVLQRCKYAALVVVLVEVVFSTQDLLTVLFWVYQ